MLGNGNINKEDLDLFVLLDDVDEVVDYIKKMVVL
jgi:hypothetical protein